MVTLYLYKIIEENVDGCGPDAEVIVGSVVGLTPGELEHFKCYLKGVKEDPYNVDFSTEDYVAEAVDIFNDKHNVPLSIIQDPFSGVVTF